MGKADAGGDVSHVSRFHGEGFELILEDLLNLPTDVPVLVEGYKLLLASSLHC